MSNPYPDPRELAPALPGTRSKAEIERDLVRFCLRVTASGFAARNQIIGFLVNELRRNMTREEFAEFHHLLIMGVKK